MQAGSRETVLVTGPEGAGKTALIETFLATIAPSEAWAVARAHCSEDSSAGVAYGPLLDILEKLCLGSHGPRIAAILQRCAPTWLAELWRVTTPAEIDRLRERTCGATPTRMWRELDEALTEITRDTPIVLGIDDAQWSDPATQAWIEAFSGRPGRSRTLLLVASRSGFDDLRTDSAPATPEPIVFELGPLDRSAVAHYLRMRSADGIAPRASAGFIDLAAEQCRGAPWLLEEVADELVNADSAPEKRGHASRTGSAIPDRFAFTTSAADFLQRKIAQLDDGSRRLLEAAAIVGRSFRGADVATVLECSVDDVEHQLAELDAFVSPEPQTSAPDGTTASLFSFRSQRCRETLLERISPPRRALLHGRIVRTLESANRDRAVELACDLAVHSEQAGDLERAVTYRRHAGDTARRRSAPVIAARHYRRALVLLESLPASAERLRSEASLQLALGRELVTTLGPGGDEVAACYERAMTLEADIEPKASRCAVLWGLWVYYMSRGPLATAQTLSDRHMELAQALGEPALLLESYHAQWCTALVRGELNGVFTHTRLGMAVCGASADYSLEMTSGCLLHDAYLSNHHVAICAGFFSAWADLLAGREEIAFRSLDAAIAHARDVEHSFTLGVALVFSAGVAASAGAAATARRYASEGRALAANHGFDVLRDFATIYEGWALVRLGEERKGLTLLKQGLAPHRDSGLALFRPFQLALAADAQLRCGMFEEAAASLREGFDVADRLGDGLGIAELHRIRGELLLATATDVDTRERARHDLCAAVEIASGQGATLLAARASQPLERLKDGPRKVSAINRMG